jgi:starvation-inducible DNA-binding protein
MPTRTNNKPATATRTGRGRNGSSEAQPVLHVTRREIQRFGTVVDLPIALEEKARLESCEALNKILADSMILFNLYKKYHWLVAGHTFYQLHLLFDKHAEEQLELIDDIAERVQLLGGIAVGDPRHAAELTTIERPPDGREEVPTMITRLLHAHEVVIKGVREAIKLTEESEDWGSNDLLMGDVLRTNELQVWFVAEHLVGVPLVND